MMLLHESKDPSYQQSSKCLLDVNHFAVSQWGEVKWKSLRHKPACGIYKALEIERRSYSARP